MKILLLTTIIILFPLFVFDLKEELGLSSSVNWTTEQTASFLNGLMKRISESTGLKTNYEYCSDEQFVIDYTKFINETK